MCDDSLNGNGGKGLPRGDKPGSPADPPPTQRPPASAAASDSRTRAPSETEYHAAHLNETSGAAYLYCSTTQVFRQVSLDAYKLYLTQVLADAGAPTDPIERMLIEQITLAHHNVGRLHVKAATAESLEEARVYIGSAALLTGEFRRTVATLKNYREPSGARAIRVEVAPVAPAQVEVAAGPGDDVKAPISELGSNPMPGATDHDATIVPFAAQSEAGAGREAEPREAAGSDCRRQRKAPRRGAG